MSAEQAHAEEARALRDELELMRERTESAEARLASVSGVTREELSEAAFKRGVEFQKANPSQKAKQYRDALKETVEALKALSAVIAEASDKTDIDEVFYESDTGTKARRLMDCSIRLADAVLR